MDDVETFFCTLVEEVEVADSAVVFGVAVAGVLVDVVTLLVLAAWLEAELLVIVGFSEVSGGILAMTVMIFKRVDAVEARVEVKNLRESRDQSR